MGKPKIVSLSYIENGLIAAIKNNNVHGKRLHVVYKRFKLCFSFNYSIAGCLMNPNTIGINVPMMMIGNEHGPHPFPQSRAMMIDSNIIREKMSKQTFFSWLTIFLLFR